MRNWCLAACACATLAAGAAAQTEVDLLRNEVSELKRALGEQREAFEARVRDLEDRLGESAESRRSEELDRAVADALKLYERPGVDQLYPRKSIFTSLQGGLFFTGLFRSRFEGRLNNIDFNGGDDGLDDSGIGFNGRFRLGFGAVLFSEPGDRVGEEARHMQVTALTEFQSVGTFANNSFVNVPSASGLPVPFAFSILTEPFEDVGIYQGYLSFQRLLDRSVNIKVGRQELVFGNELILGNNSFYDGTVHDSLLVQFDRRDEQGFRASFAYAKEAAADGGIGTSTRDFDEDEFAVLYAEAYPSDDWRVDAYALYFNARSSNGDVFVTGSTAFIFDGALTPPILGHHWTLGSRVFTNLRFGDSPAAGGLALNFEAAYQFGEDTSNAAGDRSIHGWTAEFIANLRIPPQSEGLKPI
ncbi:MAG TPA: hypothetical protein VEI02_06515, partial [Planctomycetota bacterium]|nr:hypothetical protein [Planctomycetota bacterium]